MGDCLQGGGVSNQIRFSLRLSRYSPVFAAVFAARLQSLTHAGWGPGARVAAGPAEGLGGTHNWVRSCAQCPIVGGLRRVRLRA